MQRVIGRVATPAASAPYPPTVWSCRTRKNRIAPRAAYTSRVITLAALKVRLAEQAERQHRLPLALLGQHEHDPGDDAGDRGPRREPVAPLDQRVGDAAQREGRRGRAEVVEVVGRVGVAGLGDGPLRDQDRGDRDAAG